MSDDDHATALLALVNARLAAMATPREAYEADDAPKTGGNFVSMSLTRRFGGNGRVAGVDLSPSAWRVSFRAVGVGVTNARVLLSIVSEGVEGKRITVGGVTSTPLRFETEDAIGEDEFDTNLWSGMRSYTYSF